MPEGPYQAESTPAAAARTLVVPFHGEDGRRWEYDFSTLPFPAFHAEFAAAFAVRTGPVGGLRTKVSADASFQILRRFLLFLESLKQPPRSLADLTPRHVERFRLQRSESSSLTTARADVFGLITVLRHVSPPDLLDRELREYLQRPGHSRHQKRTGLPGYSDREFRDIMTAARSDVAAIRDRMRKSDRLLETFRAAPKTLTPDEQATAVVLDEIDRTGIIPDTRNSIGLQDSAARFALARQMFLIEPDLVPLIVLGIGLTGRNAETIKELPTEHRVVEDRAVAVTLIKRRRSKGNNRDTVHWEIGTAESRQLHTPGGYYLLLHDLTRRGRRLSGGQRIWSIWAGAAGRRGADWETKSAANGHIDPFAARLNRSLRLNRWSQSHELTDDSGQPLALNLNRLKTTVEVRTTKAVGGHLPSASRTNTLDVSFAHYLQGDPRIREWADQVITSAIDDAENTARAFRPRILDSAGEQALATAPEDISRQYGTEPDVLKNAMAGELDTLASSCLSIDHSPFTKNGRCDVSFLTCLRCPNALIAERHLPALLAVVDALQAALETTSVDAWIEEHGRTWLMLTRLILPKFTDAQREKAAQSKPVFPGLDLLDGPKEPR
ncbi:hypothetical protein HTV80_08265 [Streptomyces sp. Vc74B-19]|uniref:hypothetical protein n=1 Tax=Streptomyces sp. Vc74B-19 TaxID=2741324 RepID=UPI001BFC60CC|nr:hypothetical protein [Streptomyces sp. Vc74B-19]MBT3163099.1 hypothetical protein [Streptomyces sp. Vc74B-19]